MKMSYSKTKKNLGEVQSTLRWAFSVIKAPQITAQFDETISGRCTSATTPIAEMAPTQVEVGGHTLNFYLKTVKNGVIDLEFVEGTDAKLTAFLYDVVESFWSEDGEDTQGVQSKSTADLQGDYLLELLDGSDKVTQSYVMKGAVLKLSAGYSMSQAGEAVLPSVTCEYEDFYKKSK